MCNQWLQRFEVRGILAMAYEAESEFCFVVVNLLREKCKGQNETKFSASYPCMRIAIGPLKKFRMVGIEYNVECLNDEFVSMPCRDWNGHQNLTLKNFV